MKRPSYISSSRTLLAGDRLGEFLLRLALFLALVLAVDRTLLLLQAPDQGIFGGIAVKKEAQVLQRLDAGLDFDTVFIGSSQAEFAFAPQVFDRISGGRSYNAGVGGFIQTNRHYELMARILDSGRPSRIIYHLDNFLLNQAPRRDNAGQLVTSFQSMRLIRNGLHNALLDAWQNGLPALREPRPNLEAFASYTGYVIHDDGWVEGNGIADPTFIRHSDMVFDPKPDSVTWLHRIADLARERGVDLVLVQTPLHPAYRGASRERLAAFAAWMRTFASEKGIRFLDFSASLDDGALYFDTNHLNAEGSRRFTGELARRL